ncbi:diaminopimelate epimerase [Clostridium sp. D2Q-11]|uniref:Diaminopimelate epimerase n=1 Tax=Anaeromonas frigoriresistens TaxID=2683708 RepID=A0A942UW79_9FIRM|nr:diaminopimelate epimerase [Anaeromonas frigoriresistens]MBS4539728.1 diaminopimelate epimerase [Anaeromonas frigoriresistens]
MLNFSKYHGLGNDFIIIDGRSDNNEDYSKLAKEICHRNLGIGGDGLIIIKESHKNDIRMQIFNIDGSEAPMCGNGIRCFAKYVYENDILCKDSFIVETLAGPVKIRIIKSDGKESIIQANMGKAHYKGEGIPIGDEKGFINKEIVIDDTPIRISTIDLGNIHTVLFVDDLDKVDVDKIGPMIEKHDLFPNKTNVNFCEIIDKQNIKLVTWERGVGKTLACGTGASASAVISTLIHDTDNHITLHLPGGDVDINTENEDVYMTGPAEIICKGIYL